MRHLVLLSPLQIWDLQTWALQICFRHCSQQHNALCAASLCQAQSVFLSLISLSFVCGVGPLTRCRFSLFQPQDYDWVGLSFKALYPTLVFLGFVLAPMPLPTGMKNGNMLSHDLDGVLLPQPTYQLGTHTVWQCASPAFSLLVSKDSL